MSTRPTLKITRLGTKRGVEIIRTRTPSSPGLTELGALIIPPNVLVIVRLLRHRRFFRTATFVIAEGGTAEALALGMQCVYVRADELRAVKTVLSPSLTWQDAVFHPRDGVEVPWGEFRAMRPITGSLNLEELPPEAVIVKNAWDHEHCIICNTCICETHGPEAAVSNEDDWVCRKCYAEYVVPKNIDFHCWDDSTK